MTYRGAWQIGELDLVTYRKLDSQYIYLHSSLFATICDYSQYSVIVRVLSPGVNASSRWWGAEFSWWPKLVMWCSQNCRLIIKKFLLNFLLQSCEIKFAPLARENIFSLCVLKLQIQASECLEIIPDTWSLGPGVWKFSHCLLEGK